jgi:hypothetical protein
MAMRTQDEILTKIKSYEKGGDFFGFMTGDLIEYLTFEHAKPYLKDGVTAEEWKPLPTSHDAVKAQIHGYMDFAWEKANDCRGLSAGRSINHMQVWLWMLGEETAAEEIKDYDFYGKPQLRAICEHFGWDWHQWDDGLWCNNSEEDGIPPPAESTEISFKAAA